MTPQMLATFTFVAGVVLLFSGATPADADRLRWLDRLLPLGVIEASHVTGSIAGAVLLLLSQGLARRLDAAYYLTMITVIAGVVASLLKGFDYEEALLLIALTAVLRLSRPAFNRRAAFFATRFSTAWIAAVAAALVASVWLGLFAFKHVEYSQRSLVAVRARRQRIAFPARIGWCGNGRPALRRRAAHRARTTRSGAAIRTGSRGRRPHHRRAGLDAPVSGLPRRQGAALRRSPRGVHHVRCPGTDVGGAR